MSDNLTKGYVYGLAAVTLWCGFILVSRSGGLSELSHFDVIALRYGTCAVILLPIWWFKYRFNFFQTRYVIIALIGGLAYALSTFQAFQLAPASHGALLLPGTMPLFMFLMALGFSQVSFNWQKLFGVLFITLGIALLFLQQATQSVQVLLGDGLFLIGALSWGLFSVLVKHWSIRPWHATISVALLTAVMYLPVYFFLIDKSLTIDLLPQIIIQMVYQGVLATIIQLILFIKAVEIMGAASMGALMALVPLVSGVAALFVFNEPSSGYLIMALMLVVLGTWLSHSKFVEAQFLKCNINK